MCLQLLKLLKSASRCYLYIDLLPKMFHDTSPNFGDIPRELMQKQQSENPSMRRHVPYIFERPIFVPVNLDVCLKILPHHIWTEMLYSGYSSRWKNRK